jgi:epoxide hydrolase-like predicted phosphatase
MFDVGGVLNGHMYEGNDDVNVVDEEIKNELGLSDEQINDMWGKYLRLLLIDAMTEVEMWQKVSQEHGTRPVADDERLIVRAFEKNLEKNDEVYKIVDDLKKKGIEVMLLTNVTRSFAEVLESKGHYEPFERKVLSYKVGLAKPDNAIYELSLKEADVKPNEAVFVDDVQKNIDMANSLGIHGVLFRGPKKLEKDLSALIKK